MAACFYMFTVSCKVIKLTDTHLALRYLPNLLTIIRLLLIIPISYSLLIERYHLALLLFIVAAASDGLDGFLARKFGWHSRFGAMVDPLADKLMLMAAYIMLTILGHFPLWLTATVIVRDLVIVSGAVSYHFLVGQYEFKPSRIGKLSTFLQIMLALLTVMHLTLLTIPTYISVALIFSVAVVTVMSGLDYVWVWSQKYRQETKRKS